MFIVILTNFLYNNYSMKKLISQSNSIAETLRLAKKIFHNLGTNRLIVLSGELGSGKTTFVQQLGKVLKIKNKITSPSFVLQKIYPLPINRYHFLYLCHLDFYRTYRTDCSVIKDYLNNPKILTIIEWPEKISKLPHAKIKITISIMKKNTRKFTVLWPSETK